MKHCFLALLLIAVGCQSPKTNETKATGRMITAGGTVTEIVYELGFGDQIIATDITSTYPASMKELPSIGYRNQIKAEGILALGPEVLLAEEGYISPEVLTQLESTGLKIKFFDKPTTLDETIQTIQSISEFLGVKEKGQKLVDQVNQDLAQLNTYLADHTDRPSMAFVMARGQEMVFLAGEETFAANLMEMSGIRPTGVGFKEFIPLTPEALVSMNPDYLLFFESGIQSIGGQDGLKNIRGIESTTAYKKGQILAYDGLYLSGFGPRIGKAALELAKAVRSNP